RIGTEFRAGRLDFIDGALAHQQTPADAADQNGKAWVAMLRIKSAAGLARRVGGAGGETIQVSAHQLRRPALRDVAGEVHRALVAIDRQHGAHDGGVGPLQVVDLNGKQQCGAGQPLRFVGPEIALIEIERRLAIELIEDIAYGSRHLPAGSEQVPSAGAAMADPDGSAIEADAGNDPGARRAIGPDQRLLGVGAVAGQSPGQRNVRADGFTDTGYQLAAVDVQAVGQDEHAREVVGVERPPERLAEVPGAVRVADLLPAQPQLRRFETYCCRDYFVVTDVVVVDLPTGAAAEHMGGRKHGAQLFVSAAAGKRLTRAKVEHERGVADVPLGTPAGLTVPDDMLSAHFKKSRTSVPGQPSKRARRRLAAAAERSVMDCDVLRPYRSFPVKIDALQTIEFANHFFAKATPSPRDGSLPNNAPAQRPA